MKLVRVQRVLIKRLAFLSALVEREPHRRWAIDERDALHHTILRCQGMLDAKDLEQAKVDCETRILPHVTRQSFRARRGDQLAAHVDDLLVNLQRAMRAA